jgi:hypothetical protein
MDSLSLLNGEPVQIVKIRDDDHSFFLDEEALNSIMSDKEIKDKPVCIVSVAGRKEKCYYSTLTGHYIILSVGARLKSISLHVVLRQFHSI